MNQDKKLWNDVEQIRLQCPLIHNITNYVVMEFTANALLAIGASPVMAHAPEEVADMAGIAQALVLNMGTLSVPSIDSMHRAADAAEKRGIPIVFDPVGCGATPFRIQTAEAILARHSCSVIRGNASELASLAGMTGASTKGVDSTMAVSEASLEIAQFAQQHDVVVAVSGEVDLIVGKGVSSRISNGHAMMEKVTGMGCTATALVAAFCAVNSNYAEATAHAMTVMGIVGELAGRKAKGPGSFKSEFLDALYALQQDAITEYMRVEPVSGAA